MFATNLAQTQSQQRPETFENGVVQVVPQLYARALRLAGTRPAADDLLQDTMVRALDRWVRFRPGSDLRAWLRTIMQHLFVDQCRDRSRLCAPWSEAERADTGAAGFVEEQLDAPAWERISNDQLVRAHQQLHPSQREVIRLVFLEGLSYKSAAARLGIPISTVGTRVHRARVRLRQLLAEAADEAP
jgi:RNA polymerase sigma-70 factor (ECF subfamily)